MTNGENSNQTVTSVLLENDLEFYRIVAESEAINASLGTYSFLTKDILHGTREVEVDAGAEEFGAGGINGPYDIGDVGVNIGFGSFNTLAIHNESIENYTFKLYPVPANGILKISVNRGVIGDVKLYNIQGKLIKTDYIMQNSGTIDISLFSSGIYILKTKNQSLRFVIDF